MKNLLIFLFFDQVPTNLPIFITKVKDIAQQERLDTMEIGMVLDKSFIPS